jgi:hypothetical protein
VTDGNVALVPSIFRGAKNRELGSEMDVRDEAILLTNSFQGGSSNAENRAPFPPFGFK